jgi:hypothetical protein
MRRRHSFASPPSVDAAVGVFDLSVVGRGRGRVAVVDQSRFPFLAFLTFFARLFCL